MLSLFFQSENENESEEEREAVWLFLVKPLPRSIRNTMEDSPVSLSSKANGNAKIERF